MMNFQPKYAIAWTGVGPKPFDFAFPGHAGTKSRLSCPELIRQKPDFANSGHGAQPQTIR